MSSTCSKFLPAVQSQSDFRETKGTKNSQGCLTKLVLVLHGNQLLIPLSFIPTQHQSGSLPSQSIFCLHVWMLNQLVTKLLKEFYANSNIKFNIAVHLTGMKDPFKLKQIVCFPIPLSAKQL